MAKTQLLCKLIEENMQKLELKNLLPKLLFLSLLAGNSLVNNAFGAPNYDNMAERMSNNINDSQAFKGYLETATNLDEQNKQKTNPYLDDPKFVAKIKETSDRAFNQIASNQQLKSLFPKVDFDALKTTPSGLEGLMIFVSSSIPPSVLKQFSLDAKKAGGVLVLRGLINDSFNDTVSFIQTLNDKGTRAIIDPNAFRLFDVRQVPEIVVVVDNNNCQSGRCDHTPFFDKMSGAVTLEYALDEISKRGEFTNKEAIRFLNALRSKEIEQPTKQRVKGGGNV